MEDIHLPRFRRLNLNLLFALDTILRNRTLTEAAAQVSLTQPALSLSLKKLREHFQDELVVYGKSGSRLTDLAMELRPRVGRILRETASLFSAQPGFDPAADTRTITLAAPEAIEIMYLPRVASAILRDGPLLSVRLSAFQGGALADLFADGVDVAVVPEPLLDSRFERAPLFAHGVACLVWNEHPFNQHLFEQGDYLGLRHAAMAEPIERLAAMGMPEPPLMRQRDIAVRTEHYSALANLIVGTELVVTTSSWLAQHLCSYHPLRIIAPPFRSPPLMMFAQWESHRSNDAVMQWILGHLHDACGWAGADIVAEV